MEVKAEDLRRKGICLRPHKFGRNPCRDLDFLTPVVRICSELCLGVPSWVIQAVRR